MPTAWKYIYFVIITIGNTSNSWGNSALKRSGWDSNKVPLVGKLAEVSPAVDTNSSGRLVRVY